MKRGSGESILKAFLYTMSICLSGYQSICLSDRLYSIQLSVCLFVCRLLIQYSCIMLLTPS